MTTKPMVLYLAGPYRPLPDRGDIRYRRTTEENIAAAREIAQAIWHTGHVPLCPHLNSAGMQPAPGRDERTFLDGDLLLLDRCDGMVLMPRWQESEGAKAEREYALARSMPIWAWPEMPASPTPPTPLVAVGNLGLSAAEQNRLAWLGQSMLPSNADTPSVPAASRIASAVGGSPRFHEILHELGALHDKKQRDYGRPTDPFANVRASVEWGVTPWVGALIRATDKLRRLQTFAKTGTLANEGVEDSLRDLAVYAIIALVLWEESR